MKRHILPLLLLTALGAAAQDLNKSITIESEFNPTLRAASRLNNYPQLLQPQIDVRRLAAADYTTPAEITPLNATLAPALSAPAIPLSPYRGYAAIGYFPGFNLGASAGYSIIAKPRTSLNAYLQYDGNSYKSTYPGLSDKIKLNRNTVTIGADLTHIFPAAGRLDISAAYTLDALNRPCIDDKNLTVNRFNLDAGWAARRTQLGYFVNARYTNFSFSDPDQALTPLNPSIAALAENRIDAKGGVAYFLSDESTLAGTVEADFAGYNHFNRFDTPLVAATSKTIGVLTFIPAYRYHSDMFDARLGARLQYTSNSGKAFHAAPDVEVTVTPSQKFGATLLLGGGEHINSLTSLFDYTPYLSPSIAYGNSHIPFTADITLRFGPFTGLTAELSAGYAIANDWLMPVAADNTYIFSPVNIKGAHAGASVRYTHSRLFSAGASATFAPGSYKSAWYLNRDRAKTVIKLDACVNPIDRLSVEASWNLRSGRSAYPSPTVRQNLGNANFVNIGASYDFTDAFTLFANVENLLDSRPQSVPGLQDQGLKGLVGVTFKF